MQVKEIIKKAGKMRYMLESVYSFNSSFSLTARQKISLAKIIEAITIIDRKFFVSYSYYDDNALAIGYGQTISQPSTVTRMLLLADLRERQEVLEIGAGSGWNAALIAYLVKPGKVLSTDRVEMLVEQAKINVKKLPFELGLDFVACDALYKGSEVWQRKYDRIIITAGIPHDSIEKRIEEMAFSLLKEEGLLICPYTSGPLLVYKKNKKLEKLYTKEQYVFVPLLEGTE